MMCADLAVSVLKGDLLRPSEQLRPQSLVLRLSTFSHLPTKNKAPQTDLRCHACVVSTTLVEKRGRPGDASLRDSRHVWLNKAIRFCSEFVALGFSRDGGAHPVVAARCSAAKTALTGAPKPGKEEMPDKAERTLCARKASCPLQNDRGRKARRPHSKGMGTLAHTYCACTEVLPL